MITILSDIPVTPSMFQLGENYDKITCQFNILGLVANNTTPVKENLTSGTILCFRKMIDVFKGFTFTFKWFT